MKKQKMLLCLIAAGLISFGAGAMAKDSGVDTGNPKGNPTDNAGGIIKEAKPGAIRLRLGAGPDELGPKIMKRKPTLNA